MLKKNRSPLKRFQPDDEFPGWMTGCGDMVTGGDEAGFDLDEKSTSTAPAAAAAAAVEDTGQSFKWHNNDEN
jgi:hypothetical protein